MLYCAIFLLSLIASSNAAEDSLTGVWQTIPGATGHVHVDITACESGYCGTIIAAFDGEGIQSDSYEHLGKPMVWSMRQSNDSSWAGGKIWDPSNGKTYKSKMSLEGDVLTVSGCVLFFCKSQDWTRVK